MHNRANLRATLFGLSFALGAAVLAACGGGGGTSGGGNPVPTGGPTTTPTGNPGPTPTTPGSSSATIVTQAGSVSGTPYPFPSPLPSQVDTSAGGLGQPMGGMTCDTTMSNNYHTHFFLGVFYNGTEYALPAGAGMNYPQPPSGGFVNLANCFYHVHTHDASGIVHIEDPNPNGIAITSPMYTLGTFMNLWGLPLNANQFGQWSGPVRVFTTGQTYRGGVPVIPASDLTYWAGDPNTIPLYSHEVIYVEIGPNYPTTLPNVRFYEQF